VGPKPARGGNRPRPACLPVDAIVLPRDAVQDEALALRLLASEFVGSANCFSLLPRRFSVANTNLLLTEVQCTVSGDAASAVQGRIEMTRYLYRPGGFRDEGESTCQLVSKSG
jgi:hypothetical protein